MQNRLLHALLLGLTLLAAKATQAQATWQWAYKMPDATPSLTIPIIKQSLADGAGNTYVLGIYTGVWTAAGTTLPYGVERPFIGRFNQQGAMTSLLALSAQRHVVSQALLTPAGDLVLAGYYLDATFTLGIFSFTNPNPPVINSPMGGAPNRYYPKGFVARLSPTGVWTQVVSTTGPGTDYLSCLALDTSTGDVLVSGGFDGTTTLGGISLTGANALLVGRLSAAGTWTQAVKGAEQGYCEPVTLAVAPNGDVVLAGIFHTTTTFGPWVLPNIGSNDLAVARLNRAGTWTQAVRAGGQGTDYVRGMVVYPDNSVTISGEYESGITFGSTVVLPTPTQYCCTGDIYVAHLDPAGVWTQVVVAGNGGGRLATGLGLDAAGNLTLAGYFSKPTIQFGNLTLTNPTPTLYPLGFVASLSSAGIWRWAERPSNSGAIRQISFGANDFQVAGFFGGSYGPLTLGANTLTSTDGTAFLAAANSPAALPTRAAIFSESFTLTPNPAKGLVQITWPVTGITPRAVSLLDALGREVRHQLVLAPATTATLDVAGLPPGIYVARSGSAASRLQVE